MEELSLHILDIVQNSVAAKAELIEVEIVEDIEADTLTITITDNGCGMSEEMVKKVVDPFTTGRKTRRVGLGIPLFKLAAELTGGDFEIESELGKGTRILARFGHSHIDRQPLGDIASTMHQLIVMNENTDFLYVHKVNGNEFKLDTREVKEILGGVSLAEYEVMVWLLEYLKENEDSLYKTVGKE
ncbi:MAG: ATP-binding protein [Eubacteriales bacterium]|nr:ATP-binding protein [Eubacteriales bacterium]